MTVHMVCQQASHAAARIKQRRRTLGMTAEAVADSLGVPVAFYDAMEQEFGLRDQRRYGRALAKILYGKAPARRRPLRLTATSVAGEIQELGGLLSHLSGQSLPPTAEQTQRRAEVFGARYGLLGPEQTTLSGIASRTGGSLHAAREVLLWTIRRAAGIEVVLPAFDKLKEAVMAASTPRDLRKVEKAHRDLLGGVTLSDADRFSTEVLGEPLLPAGWARHIGLNA